MGEAKDSLRHVGECPLGQSANESLRLPDVAKKNDESVLLPTCETRIKALKRRGADPRKTSDGKSRKPEIEFYTQVLKKTALQRRAVVLVRRTRLVVGKVQLVYIYRVIRLTGVSIQLEIYDNAVPTRS
jgi:hypothetical protein